MTRDEKCILIAKDQGLEVIDDPRGPVDTRPSPFKLKRDVFYTPEAAATRLKNWPKSMAVRVVPDYFGCLNKCRKMEEKLTDDELWKQSCILVGWLPSPSGFPLFSRSEVIQLRRVTATQRAEAYGLARGLWKEGE